MATVSYIPERKQTVGAMKAVVDYCMQEKKTVDPATGIQFISGVNCIGASSFTEFLATKAAYRKLDGMQFYQYVQSFSPKEKISHAQAHEIALEFAAKAWPGHEVLVCTHCDAAHIHSHFVINSVSVETGKKLRQNPNTLKELRNLSDEICEAHGFSTLKPYEKDGQKLSSREYRAARKGGSWKFQLMNRISYTMTRSASVEDFQQLMRRYGYEMTWTAERKQITFLCPGDKKCRSNRLHDPKYEKENIENEFAIREQLLRQYLVGETCPEQRGSGGSHGTHALRDDRLRHPGAEASGRGAVYGEHGGISESTPGLPFPAADGSAPEERCATPDREGGAGAEVGAGFPSTGWEREQEIFFRNLENALRAKQTAGSSGTEAVPSHPLHGGGFGSALRSAASLASVIESDEDSEERRRRIEAEQNGSVLGAVLGLAIGAAMALTAEEEEDYQEYLVEQEALGLSM